MQGQQLLVYALIFLCAAVVVVPLFRRLGLGAVIGYMAAGSIIGPAGFGLFRNVDGVMSFAELGVVFLLFLIGLELKPQRLWVMRKAVFGMGGVQMLATTLLLAPIGIVLGLSWSAALVAATALSLSSTAFATQTLAEKNQLNTQFGRLSFGILLFQDLVAIPLLAFIPLLSPDAASTALTPTQMLLASAKVALVILSIIAGGRWVLKPLLRLVAAARTKEVFTAATLLIVLGVAFLMHAVGVSMALGAFLGGLIMAESEFRHALEADLDPFKGLLLGLFFLAVGMSIDWALLLQHPLFVGALVIGLLTLKALVLYGVGRVAGLGSDASRQMAAAIAQGGEFAFVIFGVGLHHQLFDTAFADKLVLAVTLSLAASPLMSFLNDRFLCTHTPEKPQFDTIDSQDNPVIIAGFGRVGQVVARLLRLAGIGFTALEYDIEHVNAARRFGAKLFYGDASRPDLLEAAGARRAKFLVLAIQDSATSLQVTQMVQERFPHLKIIARARNRQHVFELMARNVAYIRRDTFDGSLRLAGDLLLACGVDAKRVTEVVERFREYDEKLLLEQYKIRDDEKRLVSVSREASDQLIRLFQADQSADRIKTQPISSPSTNRTVSHRTD